MIPPLSQNNPVPPEPDPSTEDPFEIEDPIGMTTYLVDQLKQECDELGRCTPESNPWKWVLTAFGVSFLVLSGIFIGLAVVASNLILGQIGIYLIPASVFCFALIPLFEPINYETIKGLIDRDLVEFAEMEDKKELNILEQGKIKLTPDNIALYHEVKRLVDLRS